LITSSWDKTIRKWNKETGECLLVLEGHQDFVKSVKLINGKIYSCSSDKTIRCWDLESGSLLFRLVGHGRSVEDICVSPQEDFLFSCSSDGSIKKWDLREQKEVCSFVGHESSVYKIFPVWEEDVLWSGNLLIILVSADKSAIKWDSSVRKY
jgi:WD40 repeat protein